MNLGLLRSISALHQQPLPKPGHQLMCEHSEINIPLGMTGETQLAFLSLQGCSNTVPAKLIGVSIDSGNRTPPLQRTATQNLERLIEIFFSTHTTAVGSEQNQLGSI
jgi:hypothetical protein